MAISIGDLLKLPYFSSVTVEAGGGGQSKYVTSATILDYEYAKDYAMAEQVFVKGDLLVSSLLFAKEDPAALLRALEELIGLGAAGLAYKTVFFDALPPEILALAEEHQFPILRFGMDLFMEEFIFHVMDNIRLDRQLEEKEAILGELIEGRISGPELRRTAKALNPYLDPYLDAVYVRQPGKPDFRFLEGIYRGPTGVKHLDESITVCRYYSGFFLLFSDIFEEEKRYIARLEDVLAHLDLKKAPCWMGRSRLCRCPEELHFAVQQAYFAGLSAQVQDRSCQDYDSMREYQFLAPHRESPHLLGFMERFLAPVLGEHSESAEELLKTAVEFVLADGDVDRTAERLYCHKNTVRYRVKKLHERLDPAVSDMAFLSSLSTAIKIYLLNRL